jgi:NDP-sugar pyrophosphorylase family protein
MILAAGVGSRLDPVTRSMPKPLVPVINQPVMSHIISLLARHGFTDICCNTHYLAEKIESHFAQNPPPGVTIQFNREAELLGTAGGVKRVAQERNFFDTNEPFLVIGGDDLTHTDLSAMLEFHKASGAVATIALTEVEDPSQFGVVVLEDMDNPQGGAIKRFVEKPPPGTAPSNLVNTGIYLFEPEILESIPPGQFYDFGKQVFPELLEAGKPFVGFKTKDYWRDVGNLREYRECHDDFFEGHLKIETMGEANQNGSWIGEGCQIDSSAKIEGPCVIGTRCTIGANAIIREHSVLGSDCFIGEGATVVHSVLWSGARVEAGTHLEGCIVGSDVEVASNAGIFQGTIVNPKK